MDELLFTPSAILSLLFQIDELKDLDVGISETIDNKIQVQVGESTYLIDDSNAVEITVDNSVVDEVEDANQAAYQDLADSGEVELSEPIESGILKELAKTLLVGGMVRLTKKFLK